MIVNNIDNLRGGYCLKTYNNEKEGQLDFYGTIKKIDGTIPEYDDFTDGVIRGTILEFKLKIDNKYSVLLQTIKYLSKKRNNGKDIPSQILLVSLNEEKAYLYNSNDFLEYIEKQYVGSASKNNKDFFTDIKAKEIYYNNNYIEIVNILKNEDFIKTHIDFYCVVGYANRFYNENPKKTKIDFFEELRNPKNLPIYPWNGNEEDFKYIMDCLNDNQHKKELGAFYTPIEYCKLSTKLVREAIKRIKITNKDYIILDRCAGTGNLEQFLTDKDVKDITIEELDKYLDNETKELYLQDKKNVIKLLGKSVNYITMEELEEYKTNLSIYDFLYDNELSHTIVNTYELKEWVVLNALIGDKVKMIIPPVENVKQNENLVSGGDALSEYFITGIYNLNVIENDINKTIYSNCIEELNSYVENENINVIMLENPPYRDMTTNSNGKATKGFTNFIKENMKKFFKGSILNDLSNLFIWSAFEYYLKKENDFYIVFSPVKYFKSYNLCNKTFIDGYLLNRKYFHASPSAVSLIMWQNIDKKQEEYKLKIYDIINENINYIKDIIIKKVYRLFSELYFDKRKDDNYISTINLSGFNLDSNSVSLVRRREQIKGHGSCFNLYNTDIAYLRASSFNLDNNSVALTRIPQGAETYSPHGKMISNNNYITKLPLFCAKLYPQENWYETDVYFTTADGGEEYIKDKDFLKSCLIYTCLCRQNKCVSFYGSDGRFYKNELCFYQDTIANNDLKMFDLNKTEKELFKIWNEILILIKETKNYNKDFTYGLYQIDVELNTYYKLDINGYKIYPDDKNYKNKKNSSIYFDYQDLNSNIEVLKSKLKDYYKNYIQDKLFKYELLK